MTHEGEPKHINFKKAGRIALAGFGTALLLSSVAVTTEGASSVPSQKERQIIPVPCTEPMPWERDLPAIKNTQSTVKIEFASVKLPEQQKPTIGPECWVVNPTTQSPNSPTTS